MTAVLDLGLYNDHARTSGWLVRLHNGIRDVSTAVRLPGNPGDVLAIGRAASSGSRRTPDGTVAVTPLLLKDDRTPPQVSGDHAEICMADDGSWTLRHNSRNAGTFINEGPAIRASDKGPEPPRVLQHGDKIRFGGGKKGTDSYSDRFVFVFEIEEEEEEEEEEVAYAASAVRRLADDEPRNRDNASVASPLGVAPSPPPDEYADQDNNQYVDAADEESLQLQHLPPAERAGLRAIRRVVEAEDLYAALGLPSPATYGADEEDVFDEAQLHAAFARAPTQGSHTRD